MKMTVYKNVPIYYKETGRLYDTESGKYIRVRKEQLNKYTRPYRKMMDVIGDCLAKGGHVDFEQTPNNTVNATLVWGE
jgi:hypothetical protein